MTLYQWTLETGSTVLYNLGRSVIGDNLLCFLHELPWAVDSNSIGPTGLGNFQKRIQPNVSRMRGRPRVYYLTRHDC